MARIFLMGLILWLQLLPPVFAGEISGIEVGKQAQHEIEINIKGQYESYRAFTLQAPFRFIIDLEGAKLKRSVPKSVPIAGSILSGIRAGQGENRARIVLDSATKDEIFHCNIQEKEGGLQVKCWKPKGAKGTRIPGSKPAVGAVTAPLMPPKDLGDLFGRPELGEGKQEPREAETIRKFTGEKITLDFYKTDIHNVFRLFAEISGKNIIVDDRVKGDLTLALKEVPWDLALDIILDVKKLKKEDKLNTYIILPMPEQAEGKGELIVRKFSEEVLQPARLRKRIKENRQQAQEIIINAHNLETDGKNQEALNLYEKAFGLWHDNIDLIKKTAYLHYTLGNYARSYYFSGQALKMNPKDAEAALYAALPAVRMGKNEEAKLLFEMALKGSPKIPEAFYNYGLFLERQKDYDNSLYIYQKYEMLFGPSLQLSLAIARLYEAQERTEDACKKYREVQFSGFSIDEHTEGIVRNKIKTLCQQGED
jgi:type IV pilus assembly protein PilQ